ncbi:hypothetical protein [Thermobacillus sp. ZCTH02-B1]|uniref:hypothetical protein n=1 Tax=Thermobacillus sp. ZCTH02-B1 TaxID=1858795 RepID=UPI0025E321C6|nr:hypothetical protein [Thermobacillus sp. ZCTH02-B1]
MPFRPIDFQTSIPRTPDASTMYGQQMARPAAEQQMLAAQSEKETERLRQKSTAPEETENRPIRDGQPRQQGGGRQRRQQGSVQPDGPRPPKDASHPYKGRHIDISF